MVTPINNNQPAVVAKAPANVPSKVSINGNSSIQSENPYAEYLERWKKELADLEQKYNTLIDEKDKLKAEYNDPNTSTLRKIAIVAELGAKSVQILITGAQVERLKAKINEYSS